ncbi:glycosyltransferase family 2 protein [uncultured Methanobrevibacter sp.]|uniref:glycosyltransferase family 2 protein n=1 Tax=uncultured Methanobrevibacter sp. TaxID=253161 RepID=UPI00262E2727|nr:glycosyltransferase family 2 protein [uncultured Methanobrevibacter sp.]
MTNYRISVIIPTFNQEQDIHKTFDSVKSQTLGFEDIELIFVDDCSTDRTLALIKEYEIQFDNVKVFTTEINSGYAGKPRNIGIANSNSPYLLFLDGDDELLVNSCEYLLNKANATNADMVIAGQINVFKNGVHQHNPPIFAGVEQHFTDPINSNLMTMRPAITAKLFKKDLIYENNIRFHEDIPGQDLVFFLEALIKSSKVITLNNFYAYYRNLNDSSITFNLNERYFRGLINAYILVCDLFEKNNIPIEIQEVVLHNHISFFTSQIIKASSIKEIDLKLSAILNSQKFDELSAKNAFSNNEKFATYFHEMKNGNYNNSILDSIITDLNIEHENINLKYLINEIKNIKLSQNKIINDNEYLKKSNLGLYNKNLELLEEYEKLLTQYSKLDNEYSTLNNENDTLKNKNNNLKNELSNLKDEYKKIDDELTEIKSTKLWKLKNRL